MGSRGVSVCQQSLMTVCSLTFSSMNALTAESVTGPCVKWMEPIPDEGVQHGKHGQNERAVTRTQLWKLEAAI